MNLKGKPLIAHSIEYALANGFEGNCYVSTDDHCIEKVALEWGAKVFQRPSYIAEDTTPTVDVLQYHLSKWPAFEAVPDAIVLLQPTNPIRPVNLLKRAIHMFEKSERDSLVTFSSLNIKFGKIVNEHFFPENYKAGQRMQDLEKRYYENGLLYITKSNAILRGEIITSNCCPMVVDTIHAKVDIDEWDDLVFAEYLLNFNTSL